MAVRIKASLAYLVYKLLECNVSRNVRSKRQNIDKESYQSLYFRMVSARDGGTHDEISLAAVAREQKIKTRQQNHKHCGAFLQAYFSETFRKLVGKQHGLLRAQVADHGSASVVGRQ